MSTPDASQNPQPTRRERREQAAADALRALIRDTLLEKFPALGDQPVDLPLTLSLQLRCDDPGELRFDPDLRSQLLEQADAFLQPRESFQPGAVFDFHEGNSRATGCRPPDALSVFAGYGPLGHPKWGKVSGILGDKSPVKIFSGRELKREQVKAFGKGDKAYNLLGQLVLGPLPVPKAYQKLMGGGTWALSAQIVETRDSRAHFALRLNLLAGGLLPEELQAMLQEDGLRDLNQALISLRASVTELEQRALQAWSHQDSQALETTLRQVPKLLARVSEQLAPPRTEPPTFPQRDFDQARPEDWFKDLQRESWVLIGQEDLAHVFSGDGSYLTTFPADEHRIQQRLATGRWRPARDGEPGF